MYQCLVNAKWIAKIKKNIHKIITHPTEHYRLKYLSGNDRMKFSDKFYLAHKAEKKSLPESTNNEDMILLDIFGAINY